MNSRLFRELRDGGYLLEDHPGGCTLYERRADVERIMFTGGPAVCGASPPKEGIAMRARDPFSREILKSFRATTMHELLRKI